MAKKYIKKETDSHEEEVKEQQFRDRVALVVSVIFVLSIGFLGYKYFNGVTTGFGETLSKFRRNIANVTSETDIISSSTQRDINLSEDIETSAEDSSQITESLVGYNPTEQQENNNSTEQDNQTDENASDVLSSNVEISTQSGSTDEWRANDYNQGDISEQSYTVKDGDTLWEIAEAVYGNGGEWVRILDANSSDIGFLANGQQALIYSGQTLNLPAIN